MSFQEALDDISNSYLQDVDRVIGLEALQFAELLSNWWQDKLDTFSLIVKIYAAFAEKSALELLHGLNDILRLKGPLPRLCCSLNNDEDDFMAIIDLNGSRIYLLSHFSLQSPTWVFSTEGLSDDGLTGLVSQLDKKVARWAIQLLHIELKLRCPELPARKTCMKALHRLVQNFRVLPPSLFLRNVVQEGQRPLSGGSFADIFKGNFKELGRKPVPVCLKALRVFQVYDTEERDKLLKEFCREAFLWTQLNHENILPCFGVSMEVIEGRLCLISPWMANGNIMEFLKLNPLYDRLEAIIGIARGLSYLHDLKPQFVHGDIKGVNILVTEDRRCCLADFGLCLMVETRTIGATATSSANKGTIRWLAPELLNPADPKFHDPNKAARDIYAFACTVLEIYTGKPPFGDKMDVSVMFEVLQGDRPVRPNEMHIPSLDSIWEMVEECWVEDSHRRPQAKELVQRLESVYATPQVSFSHPQPTLDSVPQETLLSELRIQKGNRFAKPAEGPKGKRPRTQQILLGPQHIPQIQQKYAEIIAQINNLEGQANALSQSRTGQFDTQRMRLVQEDIARKRDMSAKLAQFLAQAGFTTLNNSSVGWTAQQPDLGPVQQPPRVNQPGHQHSPSFGMPPYQLDQSNILSSPTQRHPSVSTGRDPRNGPSDSRGLARERERDLAKAPTQGPRIASPASHARDSNPNPVILADLDFDDLPQDLHTEGSDWSCIFNPSLPLQALLNPKKRKNLNISLLWTLNHDSAICCVQFSSDGKYLATCNRTAQIFDVSNGIRVCVLTDKNATRGDLWIRSVKFSPDGRYLATGGDDMEIMIWDIAQKKIVVRFSPGARVTRTLDFTPDGKHIVSGSGDGRAKIWNLQPFIAMPGGLPPQGPPEDPNDQRWCMWLTDENDKEHKVVISVAVSPDGRYLATGSSDYLVRIWDINTGQLLERLHGHQNSVRSVVFTPTGKGVISSSSDRTMKYWDVSWLYSHSVKPKDGGKCLMNFVGHKDEVLSVAVSHDSQWIVSGSKDRDVQFWDSRNAHVQCRLKGHKNSVWSVALNPVGNLLASGSSDKVARIWKYTTS